MMRSRSRYRTTNRIADRPEPTPEPPLAFCPATSRLIANWRSHSEMTETQERQLADALDQVAEFGDALRAPVWLYADGRAPVAIRVDGPIRHWLLRHETGRTVYTARSTRRGLPTNSGPYRGRTAT